jgi:hypothetical protein
MSLTWNQLGPYRGFGTPDAITGTRPCAAIKAVLRPCGVPARAAIDPAKEEIMSMNRRNKFVTASMAFVVSLALVATVAGVDALAPQALMLGFIIRTVFMVGIIPVALVGFNALCDKFTQPRQPGDPRLSKESKTRPVSVRENKFTHNGTRQKTTTAERGAAFVARRVKIMPVSQPIYHMTSFSVPVPKQKWWVGQ